MVRQHSQAPKTPFHILMVTPRYFPETGGVENHVYQVAGRLAKSGLKVTVLTTDRSGNLPGVELMNGVAIKRVRAWPSKSDYYFAPGIFSYIQESKPDLVHIQSFHTLVAPLAMLAAWRAGLPYVLTFHGGGHSSRFRNAIRGLQLALLQPLLAHAERLVTLAQFEQSYYAAKLHLPQEHFILIPNGADLPTPVNKPQPSSDGTLIASVGRLERYKGHQRIIAALPFILKNRPDAWLWIAGRGPYEPELRSLASKLGVDAHVRFEAIPPEDRERMARQLSEARLVVLLSEYETQPIAILEALSLGCPTLVADTSGLSELSQQGLTRSIPIDSTPEVVASAVLDQLSHPLIPGKISLPTWDDCSQRLLELYYEISGVQR